ncbi:hypothetical protein ICA16_20900 [Pseudomonas anatoliensis]|uniref:hypothetical protein n=1 Tax=Pseudomonas anatoliensis TaxID=2710589 RepID=UPI001B32CEF8|nr:hypothetical protein [Pseudomonas anatoliensis]MBP5958140.1 hypothetical protein [Pseudomonas anatoliensis]
MKQYDWSAWHDRVKSFTGKWALERWYLMYLHEQDNVDALAFEIKARLAAEGRFAEVQVQSIWVDGTPQAEFSPKGHLLSKKLPQCELADLLLCVRWESPNGLLQREQALLIQAKVAIKYNELPGGKSTRKERLLFENCNRHKNITLYPGVNRENPIGAYQLGSSAARKTYGLRDCASFLLMAKGTWPVATAPVGPMQVGWPVGKTKTELKPPDSYLDAVISMVSRAPTMGREVKTGASAANCVWTKMVNDLRGKYGKVSMSGYGGQARVTSASTVSALHMVYSLLDKFEYFSDFVLSMQQYFRLEPRFFRWFDEGNWWHARRLKRRIDPNDSRGPDFVWAFMAHLGLDYLDQFDLWRHDPMDPPRDGDLKDDNGPYIFTQVITIRNVEEYRRRD